MRKKDSDEKSKFKPNIDFIKAYFIYILTLILSLLILYIFLCYNSNILKLIPNDKIGESLGLIISSLITVTGVFVGFYFNKKQTYKEIVTRERIEWLHKMQEALAEFMSITSKDDFADEDEYKIYRARELYYLIISNLNVKEEDGKENEREAVELLYNYARSKGLDVELNFDRNVDREEKKDSNDTKSIDESKEEKEKLKDQKENSEKKEEDHLAGLKRKEIISKYTEIFNETWNRIKDEAD